MDTKTLSNGLARRGVENLIRILPCALACRKPASRERLLLAGQRPSPEPGFLSFTYCVRDPSQNANEDPKRSKYEAAQKPGVTWVVGQQAEDEICEHCASDPAKRDSSEESSTSPHLQLRLNHVEARMLAYPVVVVR